MAVFKLIRYSKQSGPSLCCLDNRKGSLYLLQTVLVLNIVVLMSTVPNFFLNIN